MSRNVSKLPKPTVAAVDRALSILCAFQIHDRSLSLAELSLRTGLYKSTILRLLQTLEHRSFILRDARGGYRLGPILFQLGTSYRSAFNLELVLAPILEELVAKTQESASFFVAEAGVRRCLYRADSKLQVRHAVEIGAPLDISAGASGTVFTRFTDLSREDILTRINEIPCLSIGAAPLDISSISAPVFGAGASLIGALSIAGPAYRFDQPAQKGAAPLLIKAAQEVTRSIGGEEKLYSEALK